jgi:hypothetical protein
LVVGKGIRGRGHGGGQSSQVRSAQRQQGVHEVVVGEDQLGNIMGPY